MTGSRPLRIAQLSDTHFLAPGEEAEGGFAYNTDEAFVAVRDHLAAQPDHDMVVVTGDIADHGRRLQYERAVEALQQLPAPVNASPGNHDQDAAFAVSMGRPGISTSRVIEMGAWCFLFADSTAGTRVEDASGRHVDPDDYGDRLHSNGALGAREASWIREMCATTPADHVFIWLHHPPATPVGLCRDDAYTAEWTSLIGDLPNVRGLGGGHTHVPDDYVFEGRPVFVAPSFKNNFDLDAATLLPPGYRSYTFGEDGSITSDVHLCDDNRWPRHPVGRAVMSLMRGELTYAEFDEIVARKRAARML